MAMAKLTPLVLLLALIAITMLTTALAGHYHLDARRKYGPGSLRISQSAGRCSKTQYRKPCLFFCNKCCNKCLCVLPGTYGHKPVCPCYNN